MSKPNKFAAVLKPKAPTTPETPVEDSGGVLTAPARQEPAAAPKAAEKPSRRNTKHIGGYYDPAVSRQLRGIALEEDSTVQELMGEALDMLFQSRRKPTIARRPVKG